MKCRHPKQWRRGTEDGGWICRCGHEVSAEKVRRGRLARRRGNDAERRIVNRRKDQGRDAVRTGMYGGPDDVKESLFVTQSKSGPGYFSERYWRWLSALPRTGGRIPQLVVSDGRRSLTIYFTSDDEDLHGKAA